MPDGELDAVTVAGPGIRRLIAVELSAAEAIADDVVAVVRGETSALDAFATTFHIASPALQGVEL